MGTVLSRGWAREFVQFLVAVTLLLLSSLVLAGDKVRVITQPDAILSTLKQNLGKRVKIKLHSGEEMEGVVKGILKDKFLTLEEVSGYEHYEGKVVSVGMRLDEISTVILRVPSK